MSEQQSKPSGFSPWAAGIIIFFIVLAGVNSFFMYIAMSGENTTIEEDTYEKGLAYQEVIDQLEASRQLGWKVSKSYGPVQEDGSRLVTVQVTGRDGQPLSGAAMALVMKRPAKASLDTESALVENPEVPGRYTSLMKLPAPGLWFAELRIDRAEDRYFWKGREFLS